MTKIPLTTALFLFACSAFAQQLSTSSIITPSTSGMASGSSSTTAGTSTTATVPVTTQNQNTLNTDLNYGVAMGDATQKSCYVNSGSRAICSDSPSVVVPITSPLSP